MSMESDRGGLPAHAWRWVFVGQLWMLVAFVGMSLLAIAVSTAVHGGNEHGWRELLAIGLAGALLTLLAWLCLARLLRRVDPYESRSEPSSAAGQTPRGKVSTRSRVSARAGMTGITPTW